MTDDFNLDNPTLIERRRPALSLAGEWEFMVDPRAEPEGPSEEFYSADKEFTGTIRVPGCWQAQMGRQAETGFRHNYRATAYYKKLFSPPPEWRGAVTDAGDPGLVALRLGGIAPAAEVWVNGAYAGGTLSSRSPLWRDVTGYVRWDEPNSLVIRVYRPHLRLDGLWDYPFGGWEGIYRGVGLELRPSACIEDVWVRPLGTTGRVAVHVQSSGSRPLRAHVSVTDGDAEVARAEAPVTGPGAGLMVDVPHPRLWSPQDPHLYLATIELRQGATVVDAVSVRFGIREVKVVGSKVWLNGAPIFLRGATSEMYQVETVCPPDDPEEYRRRARLLREYGFNYYKVEVEAIPDEFLTAADEVGLLTTYEMPFGLQGRHRQHRHDPPAEFAALWRQELAQLVRQSRNHPSVVNYSMASELGLSAQSDRSFALFNQSLPRAARALAPDHLITDTTAGAGPRLRTRLGQRDTDVCEESYSRDVLDLPHGEAPGRDAAVDAAERPFIFHEYRWWSSYPDPGLRARYEATPTVPYWLYEEERVAKRQGFHAELPEFVAKSARVKDICRKEGFEFARGLENAAGYVLFALTDTCWSHEGLVDDFWQPKTVSPAALRRYNADTVILWRNQGRHCYWDDAPLATDLALSHYGPRPLEGARLAWRIVDSAGRTVDGGEVPLAPVEPGAVRSAAQVTAFADARPDAGAAAARLSLEADLLLADGSLLSGNGWPLWRFPRPAGATVPLAVLGWEPADAEALRGWLPGARALSPGQQPEAREVLLCFGGCPALAAHLRAGGAGVLVSEGTLPDVRTPFNDLYRTIPWNTGSSGNSGTIVYDHPALAGFPHEGFCDLQFVPLIKGAYPLDLDAWRPDLVKPVVRCIDHYRKGINKAYVCEMGVGPGRLLVTSLKLREGLRSGLPEAVHLLRCLVRYAQSAAFRPAASVSEHDFGRRYGPRS